VEVIKASVLAAFGPALESLDISYLSVAGNKKMTVGATTIDRRQAVGFDTWVPVPGVAALNQYARTETLLRKRRENIMWVITRLMEFAQIVGRSLPDKRLWRAPGADRCWLQLGLG
jgi:hypothetical protein